VHPRLAVCSTALAGVLLAACGPLERPPNTPMDRSGIFEQIAVEGGTVVSVTSGDAGCDDPALAENAVRARVLTPDGAEADVHLLTFRNRPFWEASAAEADACVAELATRHGPGGSIERLDISPYRAWGRDWTPGLADLLQRALTRAAGDGGVPRGRDGRPLATATPTR
jgi:hypothetical protein